MKTSHIITTLLLLTCATRMQADVQAPENGDFLQDGFSYIISSPTTVTLANARSQTGTITVPAEIDYKGYHFTLTAISYEAFSNCEADTIILPATVREIGFSAFSACHNLKTVALPEGLTVLPMNLFERCSELRSIAIPTTVRTIDGGAFYGCSQLEAITLPEGLTKIGGSAFMESGLQTLDIPASLQSISSYAFSRSALRSVHFNGQLQSIGDEAFSECDSLKEIAFSGSVGTIGYNVFHACPQLEEVTLPEGLTQLGIAAFGDCTGLRRITLPQSLVVLDMGCFSGCTQLEEVTIPPLVNNISGVLFRDCTNLKQVTLPMAASTLDAMAFQNCSSLKEVVIPENVRQIGGMVFQGCSSLKRVVSKPRQAPYMTYEPFDEWQLDSVTLVIPTEGHDSYLNSIYEGWHPWQWSKFKKTEEAELGTYQHVAELIAEGNGRIIFEGDTLRNQKRKIAYTEGDGKYFTVIPDENYDFTGPMFNQSPSPELQLTKQDDGSYRVDLNKQASLGAVTCLFQDAKSIITIQQTEGGYVQLKADRNHAYDYMVRPAEGWRVHSVTYNGEDITDLLESDSIIHTPVLLSDATINIAFEETSNAISAATSTSPFHVYGQAGTLVISGTQEGETITIYTLDGRKVTSRRGQSAPIHITLPAGQVYLVHSQDKTVKIRL